MSCSNDEKSSDSYTKRNIKENNMLFFVTFCHPFKENIIDMGDHTKDEVIELFESIQWQVLLNDMENNQSKKTIYYSPSFEIGSKTTEHGIVFSAIDSTEWYIFYKSPVTHNSLFGLISKTKEKYSEIHGQTIQSVYNCMNAFLRNDHGYLEEYIK
jgi:hypothetical protein